MNKKLLAQLVVLFAATQALGLVVGWNLISLVAAGQIEPPTIVTDNPEDVANSFGLFTYIIIFTVILLIIIKIYKGWILFKAMEGIVVFGTALIVFSVFMPDFIALVLAASLVASRLVWKENLLLRNVSSIIATAGAGSLIGISLGLLPVLVFIVILAGYDIIAVFYTKHMVTLAKGIAKKNLAFTFALPTKEHKFELGTGDMVIPLTFAVSVLGLTSKQFPGQAAAFAAPAMVLMGSLVGLVLTIEYSSRHVGRALPALPPQTVLMLLMLGVSAAAGFLRL